VRHARVTSAPGLAASWADAAQAHRARPRSVRMLECKSACIIVMKLVCVCVCVHILKCALRGRILECPRCAQQIPEHIADHHRGRHARDGEDLRLGRARRGPPSLPVAGRAGRLERGQPAVLAADWPLTGHAGARRLCGVCDGWTRERLSSRGGGGNRGLRANSVFRPPRDLAVHQHNIHTGRPGYSRGSSDAVDTRQCPAGWRFPPLSLL
jgi:hypothetical protein